MICVNELTQLKCNKREVLSDFVIVLSPFAPHIAEELWHVLGNNTSVTAEQWPKHNEEYLKEDAFPYAISFNGKVRFTLEFAADASREEIEKTVLEHPDSQRWMDGKPVRKVIVVPKKIVNIVI